MSESITWIGSNHTKYELSIIAAEPIKNKGPWLRFTLRSLLNGNVLTTYKTEEEFFNWLVGKGGL